MDGNIELTTIFHPFLIQKLVVTNKKTLFSQKNNEVCFTHHYFLVSLQPTKNKF